MARAFLCAGFRGRFFVVEHREGLPFHQPGEAEQVQEEDFHDHDGPARGLQEPGGDEDGHQRQHPVAAEAVDFVAELLLFGHRFAMLGELEQAVEGDGEEEEGRADRVDDIGGLHGQLEEAHGGFGIHPAHAAREQHDSQAENARQRRNQVVRPVIADVGNQDDAGRYQHAHQGRTLVIRGGDAPPPFFLGGRAHMFRDPGGEQGQPRKDDPEQSAQVPDPQVHFFFFGGTGSHGY